MKLIYRILFVIIFLVPIIKLNAQSRRYSKDEYSALYEGMQYFRFSKLPDVVEYNRGDTTSYFVFGIVGDKKSRKLQVKKYNGDGLELSAYTRLVVDEKGRGAFGKCAFNEKDGIFNIIVSGSSVYSKYQCAFIKLDIDLNELYTKDAILEEKDGELKTEIYGLIQRKSDDVDDMRIHSFLMSNMFAFNHIYFDKNDCYILDRSGKNHINSESRNVALTLAKVIPNGNYLFPNFESNYKKEWVFGYDFGGNANAIMGSHHESILGSFGDAIVVSVTKYEVGGPKKSDVFSLFINNKSNGELIREVKLNDAGTYQAYTVGDYHISDDQIFFTGDYILEKKSDIEEDYDRWGSHFSILTKDGELKRKHIKFQSLIEEGNLGKFFSVKKYKDFKLSSPLVRKYEDGYIVVGCLSGAKVGNKTMGDLPFYFKDIGIVSFLLNKNLEIVSFEFEALPKKHASVLSSVILDFDFEPRTDEIRVLYFAVDVPGQKSFAKGKYSCMLLDGKEEVQVEIDYDVLMNSSKDRTFCVMPDAAKLLVFRANNFFSPEVIKLN